MNKKMKNKKDEIDYSEHRKNPVGNSASFALASTLICAGRLHDCKYNQKC